jgi:hypothetical protein
MHSFWKESIRLKIQSSVVVNLYLYLMISVCGVFKKEIIDQVSVIIFVHLKSKMKMFISSIQLILHNFEYSAVVDVFLVLDFNTEENISEMLGRLRLIMSYLLFFRNYIVTVNGHSRIGIW